MIKSKIFKKILGVILFLFGIFLLVNSELNITGAIVGVSELMLFANSVFGIIFIIFGIILLVTTQLDLEKIALSSSIKKHQSILRLAKDAVENQTVERELNHLIKELNNGNFEAGLGRPGHIDGTDIFYLRGRNGGRLYYHKIGENSYEIVAKSAKGRNQDRVISNLKKIYEN